MIRNETIASRTRVIQESLYDDAGMPGFSFSIPQPATIELVTSLALAIGANPAGLANQLNQVLAENLGNNMAARIKKSAKDGTALPSQADMDALYDNYDFTGIRSASGFGSMHDKILFRLSGSFIRKLLKAQGYKDTAAPVTVAKRGADAAEGQIDYDTFESEVMQLMGGEGPWGEKDAFIDLRASLVEEAEAEEERVRAAEQSTETKLAGIVLGTD
jgi:hypothetical protein